MNTFKRLDSKTIKFTKEINGEKISQTLKGVMIGDIPTEYNHWFNYKGLTYIIS